MKFDILWSYLVDRVLLAIGRLVDGLSRYTVGPGHVAKLWLNGSLDTQRNTDGAPLFNNGTLIVGREGSLYAPRSWIHQIIVRASPFTDAEVAQAYASGTGGTTVGAAVAQEEQPQLQGLPPMLCPAVATAMRDDDASSVPLAQPTEEAVMRYELGKALLAGPPVTATQPPPTTPVASPEPAPSATATTMQGASTTADRVHKGEGEAAEDKSTHPLSIQSLEKDNDVKRQRSLGNGANTGSAEEEVPPPRRDAAQALEQFERADGSFYLASSHNHSGGSVGPSVGFSAHPQAALEAAKLRLFGARGSSGPSGGGGSGGGDGGVAATPQLARPLFLRAFRSWYHHAVYAHVQAQAQEGVVATATAQRQQQRQHDGGQRGGAQAIAGSTVATAAGALQIILIGPYIFPYILASRPRTPAAASANSRQCR